VSRIPPQSLFLRLLAGVLLSLSMAVAASAQTGQTPQDPDPQTLIDGAGKALDEVKAKLDGAKEEDFSALSTRALAAQRDARTAAQAITPQLDQVQARLTQLGPVQDGVKESSDIARERKDLTSQQSALDSSRKRANLIATEAQQTLDSIESAHAQLFSEQLSTRVASPLSPALWSQLARTFPDDWSKLVTLYQQVATSGQDAVATRGYALLLTGLVVALVLVLPLRLFLRHLGRRYAASRAPGGRLRRSGLALWFLTVGTMTLGLAALVLMQCLDGIGALPSSLAHVAETFVVASFIAAFISSLSTSLLMPETPSWRLFPLDDDIARRLRWYCHATALVAWVSTLALELNRSARTGTALTVAAEGVAALLYVGLILSMLSSLARSSMAPKVQAANKDAPAPVTSRGGGVIVLVRLLGHLIVIAALAAALFGYLNLALLLASQLVWIVVVVAFIGLLMAFVDDLMAWLFRPEARLSRALSHALGVSSGRLEQVGVLVSAVLRVLLVIAGLMALVAPYGTNISVFTGWLDTLTNGLSIGDFKLTPIVLGRALLVLAIGLWVVHMVQHWLVQTYLPKTELEPGARNSVSTVARYVGWVAVCLWTLYSLGIGVGQLALVVSALSVGIGFGLQAITQNFISGLILLAERPVKIGDWVRIGDQEGDVRKINVRATEIQVGDRSTLIVPNSELITKSVRNMTLSNPMGRAQLQFSVPLGEDMERVRVLLLEIYAAHERTLKEPAPSVFIDSLANGMANFNSFVFVGSPREVYSVRSQLFFTLLKRMDQEGIALQSPQDVRILREGGEGSSGAG
jgi:small-conductance mechanosensitive channel